LQIPVLATYLLHTDFELFTDMHPSSRQTPDEVRAYIVARLADEHLTAAAVLDALRLRGSRNRVRRDLGISLADYIRCCRLDAAKRLLQETELSIAQIAYEVGYSMPEAFTRMFTREVGLTPTAYRRQCRMIKQNDQAT
jgi:AraC-like DNA-binding protein